MDTDNHPIRMAVWPKRPTLSGYAKLPKKERNTPATLAQFDREHLGIAAKE